MNTFLRIEKKYLMNKEQYLKLLQRIQDKMTQDEHGKHTISNLYYDTPQYDMIRHSLDKPLFKEKIRVRAYGNIKNEDLVFIELKRKYKGIVYKRRQALSNKDAMKYLNAGIKPPTDSLIMKEIGYSVDKYQVEPSFFIAYDRIAFFGNDDPNLRLTIDSDLRSRTWNMDLSMGSRGIPHFEEETYLMEIKLTDAIPLWLSRILSEEEIYPTSFSKYGSIYKKHLTLEQTDLRLYNNVFATVAG